MGPRYGKLWIISFVLSFSLSLSLFFLSPLSPYCIPCGACSTSGYYICSPFSFPRSFFFFPSSFFFFFDTSKPLTFQYKQMINRQGEMEEDSVVLSPRASQRDSNNIKNKYTNYIDHMGKLLHSTGMFRLFFSLFFSSSSSSLFLF